VSQARRDDQACDPPGDLMQVAEVPQGKKVGGASGREQSAWMISSLRSDAGAGGNAGEN